MDYTLNGVKVFVPPTADMPRYFRSDGRFAPCVQTVLDKIEPWQEGEDPIETHQAWYKTNLTVVPVGDLPRIWALHRGHTASKVEVSPFVIMDRPSLTSLITVELAGTPKKPKLVRAYPGNYIPPLPWQRTANKAAGGYESCVAFWRWCAYVHTANLVIPGSERSNPPVWFSD